MIPLLTRLRPTSTARPIPLGARGGRPDSSCGGRLSGPGPVTAPTSAPRTAAPVQVPVRDEPHAGQPDLVRWPVSLAEAALADACINGHDEFVALVEVCGSGDRATAVLDRVRRERRMASIADRAFGATR